MDVQYIVIYKHMIIILLLLCQLASGLGHFDDPAPSDGDARLFLEVTLSKPGQQFVILWRSNYTRPVRTLLRGVL